MRCMEWRSTLLRVRRGTWRLTLPVVVVADVVGGVVKGVVLVVWVGEGDILEDDFTAGDS